MIRSILQALSAGRRRRPASRMTLHVDPGKAVTQSVDQDDSSWRMSFRDHDTGRPVTVVVPRGLWPSLAKVMGQHLAFRELQQRRHSEEVGKASHFAAGAKP